MGQSSVFKQRRYSSINCPAVYRDLLWTPQWTLFFLSCPIQERVERRKIFLPCTCEMHDHNHGDHHGHTCGLQFQSLSESVISQIDLENVVGYNLDNPEKVKCIFKGSGAFGSNEDVSTPGGASHRTHLYQRSPPIRLTDHDHKVYRELRRRGDSAPHTVRSGNPHAHPCPQQKNSPHFSGILQSFLSSVRITSISVMGEPGASAPAEMKAYTNRQSLTFLEVNDAKPDQSWNLADLRGVPQPHSTPEYSTIVSRFSNCRTLNLYFPCNFGSEKTRILYIDIKGEWTKVRREETHRAVLLYFQAHRLTRSLQRR